jgi:4-amino-4-deoxy-L-arabinose transferase-like glycosyltransferase
MTGSPVRIISVSSRQDPESTESFFSSWKEDSLRVAPFVIVLVAAAVLFFTDLGRFPLFNPDEALYAEPAREMLQIGDWVTTYLNYVVRFTKPPIAIWGQALSIIAFGCNEFAVRFFGAAAALIAVAATYCFAEKFVGRRGAIVSSLVLATAPLFFGTARMAITDMPLSLFSCLAMFSFFLFLKTRKERTLWLGYFFVGLAVMTKGPVGLVLPAGILGLYHLLRQDLKAALRFYKPLIGLLIVVLVAVPWFALEIYITKGAYFNDFIMRENFQRFTSVIDSHRGAWWYHIAALMGGFFPWSVFIPQSLAGALLFGRVRKFWTNSGPLSVLNSFKGLTDQEDLGLYCAVWTLVTVAFFSASVSKLLPYTLPAFPAVAILLTLEFERIVSRQQEKRAAVPVVLLALAFAGAAVILPFTVKLLRDAPETLSDVLQSLACYELIFTVVAAMLLSRRYFRSGFFLFLVPTFLGMLFFGSRILTVLSSTWEEPLPAMAEYAGKSTLPVLVFDMRKPSMPFYAGRQVIQPGSPGELKEVLSASRGAYILSKTKRLQFFRDLPGCKVQYSEGKFVLVRYSPPGECQKSGSKFEFH